MIELNDTSIHAKALGETLRVAKKLRVPPTHTGGSLLGWYRQCNQIVESRDGDLSILASEYNPDLFYHLFENKVVKLCCRYGSPGRGLEYRTYLWETGAFWVDMFLMHPTTDPEKFKAFLWGGETLYSFTYPKRRGDVEFVIGDFGKDGWFIPKEGYPYLTMKMERPYLEGEDNAMRYSFRKFGCPNPDPLWGCDQIPDVVINSTYYQNLTEMMDRQYPEYWK